MNLVSGNMRSGKGGTPVIALPFGEIDAGRWRHVEGGDVLVGIRPHDLSPADNAGDGTERIPAKVHLIEPLGDVTVLDIEAGGTVIKMVLPEEQALAFPTGAELAVAFRPDAAHLFDKESGQSLA